MYKDITCAQCGVFVENVRKERKFCFKCSDERRKKSAREYYYRNKGKYDRYREENREEILKKKRERYYKNHDEIKEKDRIRMNGREREARLKRSSEYYRKNKDKVLKQRAEHYRENKDKIKDYVRKWNKGNPDKVREYSRAKRVRKKKAHGNHSIKEFYKVCEEFNWECAYCGEKLTKRSSTEDHVVSLYRGGTDLIDNIVPACRPCNSSKQEFDFFEWYPERDFYSKAREEIIVKRITSGNPQLALF